MEQQDQRDDQREQKTTVKGLIGKANKKFAPGVNYGLLISAVALLAMLIVGSVNLHRCPVNKNIPIFLIAVGVIGLVSKLVSYVRGRISKRTAVVYVESALYSVEIIVLILGTYWVYKEFQPSYNPQDGEIYCNKTAYLIAFIYITVFYGLIAVVFAGFCCFLCCATVLAVAEAKNEGGRVSAEAV